METKKKQTLRPVAIGECITRGDRLRPFKRYTSLRRFKKANKMPYSSKGWSVWDEIQAQKEENRIMAACHWSYRERYAYECAQIL